MSEVEIMAVGSPDYTDTDRARFYSTTEQFASTVGTTKATISFTNTTRMLTIANTSLNNLLVSFDSGTTWLTFFRGGHITLEIEVDSVDIKGSAASTSYEIVAVEVEG